MSDLPPHRRILLIEDDPGTHILIKSRVARLGMTFTGAMSGQDALRIIQEADEPFDLILLDYILQDTNAEEFITEHWDEIGRPPFMVLTGYGDERLAVNLMKLGAEDYIVKDADFLDHLQSAVERTMRHVSERHLLGKTERQLKESEERLNLAVQSAGLSIWDINIREMNAIVCERWRKLMGNTLPPNPVPLDTLHEAIHEEDAESYNKRWKSFLDHFEKGQQYSAEFRVNTPDADVSWIEAQWIQADSDGTARAICTLHDVTARKKFDEVEQQLRRAQRVDMLGTLAGGIAHDFNNVLASIVGYNELTQRNPGDKEYVLNNAKYINEAAKRAREIIDQILLFSRREAPEIRSVNLVCIVEEALRFIRAVVPPDLQLVHQFEIQEAMIEANSGQISQVVVNLLTNAIHAMNGREGSIYVKISEVEISHAPGEALNHIVRQGYRVDVRDEGPGVPEHLLETIFEPFFSTKKAGEGTGLGLATSKGIINSHGGRIQVQSELDVGACFSFILPCGVQPDQEEQSPSVVDSKPSSLRILLVDDEVALAEVTTQLLMLHGYEVDAFHDPVQALRNCEANREEYDIAICDFSMPRLNGLELFTELHKLMPNLPGVLITGNMNDSYETTVLENDRLTLLRKPYSHDDLVTAMVQVLPAEVAAQKSVGAD